MTGDYELHINVLELSIEVCVAYVLNNLSFTIASTCRTITIKFNSFQGQIAKILSDEKLTFRKIQITYRYRIAHQSVDTLCKTASIDTEYVSVLHTQTKN